jgi:hypothetical protein
VKKQFKVIPNECPKHNRQPIGYLRWHYESEEKKKRGMWQRQCPQCKLWFWEDELGGNMGANKGVFSAASSHLERDV